MSDLISREDAIKAVCRDCAWWKGQCDEDEGFHCSTVAEIDALPSAETHEIRTETHGVCSDLISRADAIEAMRNEIQDFEKNYMHGEDDENFEHDIGFVAGLHRANMTQIGGAE